MNKEKESVKRTKERKVKKKKAECNTEERGEISEISSVSSFGIDIAAVSTIKIYAWVGHCKWK